MANYIQEQLMFVLTSTVSLLTAWAWNSVLQTYVDVHYGHGLATRFLFAVIISILAVILVFWIIKQFDLHKKEDEEKTAQEFEEDAENPESFQNSYQDSMWNPYERIMWTPIQT